MSIVSPMFPGLGLEPDRTPVEFQVAGIPIAQGSKVGQVVGYRVKRNGAFWVKNPRAIVIDQTDMATKTKGGKRLTKWRDAVSTKAREAMGDREPLQCYVELSAEFVFARPPSHFTSTGKLTRSASMLLFPAKPDLSKVLRAVEDALTGIVYRDDVLIVNYGENTRKRWAGTRTAAGGVYIQVRRA